MSIFIRYRGAFNMSVDRLKLIQVANTWIGTPYKTGAETKGAQGGVDCSHLVHAIYHEAGFEYPYADTSHFPPPGFFTPISEDDDPENGDVILFAAHMGIYCDRNDDNVLISAQGSETKPGKVQCGNPSWFGTFKGAYTWAK
jgi:cell wall-associated NlpC family hydrolase